jgi:hypothetical protein
MVFFLFFTGTLLLSLYFLALPVKRKGLWLFCLPGCLWYLFLSLCLVAHVLSDINQSLPLKMAGLLIGTGITVLALWRRTGRGTASHRGSLWGAYLLHALISSFGICLIGINALGNFTSEKPILTLCITGATEKKEIEWKNLRGPLRRAQIDFHEVLLKRTDGSLLARHLLPGDLVAIRANIFRFPPLLNALGISTRYRLDMIYSGYRKAADYSTLPVIAHPLPEEPSFLNAFLFRYWEPFFCKTTESMWIRSASCTSHYFPMQDEHGKPLKTEFTLNIASFGLAPGFQ